MVVADEPARGPAIQMVDIGSRTDQGPVTVA